MTRTVAKFYWSATALLSVWLLIWMRLSWPAMQDDAFIHLRYAANLLHHHRISYDGTHSDYGTSSLLYVWLLAGLYAFFASPILPRMVSSFFHIVLFIGLAWCFSRTLRSSPKLASAFAVILLGILVTPMSLRWLDDGMETSLTLCVISLVAFSTSRLCHSYTFSGRSAAWLFALGFAATLTRVEYLLLFGIVSAALFFARNAPPVGSAMQDGQRKLRRAANCAAPLCGSLMAAGLIFLTMHSLVPDTAVAKSGGLSAWRGTLEGTASVFASSLSMGLLLILFWLLTTVAVIIYRRSISPPILLVNSLFPITIALAAARGQAVQGVRYFIWTLLFPIIWNTLELRWHTDEPASSAASFLRIAASGIVCIYLVLLPIESKLLYKEFRIRAQSLSELRTQHLDRLSSLRLVAFDIGYIGYFTGSPVCDLAGLVNGRVRAALRSDQRVRICASDNPQFAFLTRSDIGTLNNDLPLKDWSVCSVYDLANLRSSDLHYLIASPSAVAQVCSAAGSSPLPVEPLLLPAL